MILGEDRTLWLVDWVASGYYPPCFEYSARVSTAWHERFVLQKDHKYWDRIVPFVCGRYFRQVRWMHSCITYAVDGELAMDQTVLDSIRRRRDIFDPNHVTHLDSDFLRVYHLAGPREIKDITVRHPFSDLVVRGSASPLTSGRL